MPEEIKEGFTLTDSRVSRRELLLHFFPLHPLPETEEEIRGKLKREEFARETWQKVATTGQMIADKSQLFATKGVETGIELGEAIRNRLTLPETDEDRRALLSRGAKGVAYLILTAAGTAVVIKSLEGLNTTTKPLTEPAEIKPRPLTYPIPKVLPEKPVPLESLTDVELLNKILETPLDDPQRRVLEEFYVNRAQTLEQIDLGTMVVTTDSREKLLAKRLILRQNSTDPKAREKLTELTPDLILWAKKERIPLEDLGICIDTYPIAKRIIQKFIDCSIMDFRPDLFDPARESILPPEILEEVKFIKNNPQSYQGRLKQIKAETFMINTGGMAMLMNYETGGFVNIGGGAALSETNLSIFPNAPAQLEVIAKKVSQLTGLHFVAQNLPGSLWTPGNKSGGALSAQILPGAIIFLTDLFESVGEPLNIFHPSWAVIASWVFLALSQVVGTKDNGGKIYREGWGDFGGLDEYGLGKWNQNQRQIDTVLGSSRRYQEEIINPGKWPY